MTNYETVVKKAADHSAASASPIETNSNDQETYIGLTENKFKTRFNLNNSSFELALKRTTTTLCDHVWKLN